MKLDDLFTMVGDRELSSLPWGASAIELTNTLLSQKDQLAPTCTGTEALAKLRGLPFSTLASITTNEIQIEGSTLSFSSNAFQRTGGTPPTVPSTKQQMNPLVLIVVIVMSVVSLGLTFSSMKASAASGEQPESQTIQAILKSLTEFAASESPSE